MKPSGQRDDHRRHVSDKARLRIHQVREKENLPADGRGAEGTLRKLEDVLRGVFHPDVPTYDVNSVQGAGFDEWTYTEGLGCMMVFTQSVEINARLMREAVEREAGPAREGPAGRITLSLRDKWADIKPRKGGYSAKLAERTPAPAMIDDRPEEIPEFYTFFPPGDNLIKRIVNVDNVLRAFDSDPRWKMKPHPITTANAAADMRRTFGAPRVYSRRSSGMDILRQSSVVGYTTATEMGLMALLLRRQVVDFSLYEYEALGRYHPIYKAIREGHANSRAAINRIMECPWSGVVPLDTPADEAAERFAAYKARTLELRDRYRPLVRQTPRNLQEKPR